MSTPSNPYDPNRPEGERPGSADDAPRQGTPEPPRYGEQAPSYGDQQPPSYGQGASSSSGQGSSYGEAPSYGQPPSYGQSSSGDQGYGQQYGTQQYGTQQYAGGSGGYGGGGASSSSNWMGIAALVLGVLALLGSWIPFINLLSVALAIIGLVLGIMGMRRAKRGEATNRGLSLTGVVLSAIALVVSLVITVGFTALIGSNIDQVANCAELPPEEQQACIEESIGNN